jgi:hypothetical protein
MTLVLSVLIVPILEKISLRILNWFSRSRGLLERRTRVLQFYRVVRRLHKEHTHTYVGLFGENHIYVGCSRNRRLHMHVSVREVAYIHRFH